MTVDVKAVRETTGIAIGMNLGEARQLHSEIVGVTEDDTACHFLILLRRRLENVLGIELGEEPF